MSGTNGSFSCPGTGSFSERFGSGASISGTGYAVALGYGANVTNTGGTALGKSTTAGQDSTAIGKETTASGTGDTIVGSQASSSSGAGTALGKSATVTANGGTAIGFGTSAGDSIAIGADATTTANYQFVAGSSGHVINNIYFGKGVVNTTPTAYTINGTGGSGTNIAGGALQLAGGIATGNAAGGDILFQTSDAGSSGASAQSLTTKMTVKASGNVGIGTTSPDGQLEIAGNVSASAWGLNGIALQGTAATYTDSSTAAAGTATNAAVNSIGQSSLASTNSITTTNAFGLYLAGAPISATNQTLTNTSALYIAAAATVDGAGGTPTNSYGLYANAQTGATNNYAAVFSGGNVGVGTATPTTALEIGSSDLGNGAAGPILTLGRNTNGTNTGAGSINFQSKGGTAGYVWQELPLPF